MWLSREEMCAELGVKPRTLRDRAKAGQIERRPHPVNGRKTQYKRLAETTAAGSVRRRPSNAKTTAAVTAAVEPMTAAVEPMTAAVEPVKMTAAGSVRRRPSNAKTTAVTSFSADSPLAIEWWGIIAKTQGEEKANTWLENVRDILRGGNQKA